MTDQIFEQCILKIRQGNKDGLKQIYETYIAFIYSVIFDIIRNKESAEDVTSDFFLKLWTTVADQYQFGNTHKAYLARIAHNMAIDYIRKNGKEQLTDEIQDAADSENVVTTIGMKQETVDEHVIENISIKEAINTLKEPEQQVLNMKIFGEFTFSEISEILQIPMGTVTWRYRTAIEKLKKCGYGREVRQ